jgi:hypothetical protein
MIGLQGYIQTHNEEVCRNNRTHEKKCNEILKIELSKNIVETEKALQKPQVV